MKKTYPLEFFMTFTTEQNKKVIAIGEEKKYRNRQKVIEYLLGEYKND